MSRIWSLVACGAALLTFGCVPSSQYLEMRSKYEEEAAKNRRLIDENGQLRSQVEGAGRDAIVNRIDNKALQDQVDLLRRAGMWHPIPGTELDPTGKIMRLSHLTFRSGSADLTPKGKSILDQVAAQLKARSEIVVFVDGHTDTDPIRSSDNKSNWELSGKRAAAVMDYLVKAGAVKGPNGTIRGFSEFKPLDAKDKAKNRRVEIFFVPLDKSGQPMESGEGSGRAPAPLPAPKGKVSDEGSLK